MYTKKFSASVRAAAREHLNEMVQQGILSDFKADDDSRRVFKCPCNKSFRGPRLSHVVQASSMTA